MRVYLKDKDEGYRYEPHLKCVGNWVTWAGNNKLTIANNVR